MFNTRREFTRIAPAPSRLWLRCDLENPSVQSETISNRKSPLEHQTTLTGVFAMPGESSGSERTILVVDDEPQVRRLCVDLLSHQGFRMMESGNGLEVLSQAQNNHFEGGVDVLLTDIVMPGMDGITLAERFVERFPNTPVVFMSGYTDTALERLADSNFRWAFVAKPFQPPHLIVTIKNILQTKAEAAD
jgi:CheY-like chemotaxis protein